jgi:pyrophosphatase PpaX
MVGRGPRYEAIVFDLDGTLIDTIPLIVASHRHALWEVLGVELPESELRAGIGRPLLEQMTVFDPLRAEELYASYRRFNHANTEALLGIFDGLDEALRALAAAGARIGVATSKSRDAVDLALRIRPLAVELDVIVTIDDTDRHKPDPEPLLLAISRLGADPAGAAYVGDATVDMAAALAAGCAPIGVAWGAADEEALLAAGAIAVARRPDVLPELLLEGDA